MFHTSGLLSKSGFNDGDIPDELEDWLDGHSAAVPDGESWRRVLCRLVRERVLPVLDQRVEVTEIDGIHNPIRAVSVDGLDVVRCWYGEQEMPKLSPETVSVPFADILVMIQGAAE